MAGILGNDKNNNQQGSGIADGAAGIAKTGTGSKPSLHNTGPLTMVLLTFITVLGGTLAGVTNTVGGVVGGASRGVGETVNAVTGDLGKPLGDGVANVGTSVEGAGRDVGKSARDAGQWKTN